MHGNAWFAFEIKAYKKDEEDSNKQTLDLEYHWLKTPSFRKTIDLSERPSLGIDYPPNYELHVHGPGPNQGKDMKSGDIVRLETEDAWKYPLPHASLIEMQWNLNRAAALSAAAEAGGSWDDDDGDWSLKSAEYEPDF